MTCKLETEAFSDRIVALQNELKQELADVTNTAEVHAKALSENFEKDRDAAEKVGAVVGAAAGGEVGAAIGKFAGSFFTFEVSEDIHKFSLDLPEVSMADQEWKLDLPEVTMKDNDIIFDVPTMVMKTVRGPDQPVPVVRMVQKCINVGLGRICTDIPELTIEMRPTYLDVPTWENRQQRIVIGLPEVVMKTQKVVVGVPQVSMRTQEFSFSIPRITIRFVKDAGERLTQAATDLAQGTKYLVTQKQLAMKERMRAELVGPATVMFDCYRGVLLAERKKVQDTFQPQLDTIANTIITMKSQSVPDTDATLKKVKAEGENLMKQMQDQLKLFDENLETLNKQASAALDQFINSEPQPAEPLAVAAE